MAYEINALISNCCFFTPHSGENSFLPAIDMAQESHHIREMKTLLVSEFKNHCVGVLNEVADYGEEVIVTKRVKPLARIVPVDPPQKSDRVVGDCSQTADIVGHDESNEWEALSS